MKNIAALVCGIVLGSFSSAVAQEPLQNALMKADSRGLEGFAANGRGEEILVESVRDFVKVFAAAECTVDEAASAEIIAMLRDASTKSTSERATENELELFRVDRIRVAALFVATARSSDGRLTVTGESVGKAFRSMKLLEGFCPCWPFCQ